MAKAEVKTELKLDDLASATLSKIGAGFGKIDQSITGATSRLVDFAKQTAAVAIGVNLGDIFGSAKNALTGSFDAANKAQEQMRELAKTVAGMSTLSGHVEKLTDATGGTSKEINKIRGASKEGFETFAQGADNVYQRLAAIARASGVARGELVATFTETGKNTTKTNDQLVMLIGNVAAAARALPAPVKDIVEGFAEIEKNTISASNPLIQMVKQANLFRGHNEQIALKLQAMGRQGMLNVMNKAMKELAERAKKMPMTLKEMGDQLGDMKGDVMKLIGEPMVAALTPAFRQLQEWISSHRGEIEKYAKLMGTKLGTWIKDAAKMIQEGFNYVVTHADEIKAAIREAFDHAKSVFKWMLENKGLLAGGAVAAKVAGSGAIGGGVDAIKGVAQFATALSAANAAGIGPLAAGSAGAAASLGALGLALVGVTAVVVAFAGYLKETGGYLNPAKGEAKKNLDATMATIAEIGASYETLNTKQIAEFDKFKARALEAAAAAGENTAMVGYNIEAIWRQHRALEASAKGFTQARDMANSIGESAPKGGGDEAALDFARKQQESAQLFADAYNQAGKTGNTAALNAAIQTIVGSKSLQAALLESGETVGLSLDKLAEAIGDKAKEFVEKIKQRSDAQTAGAGNKPPPSVQVFNGGQTFNIKQDFRDQDPDRIALIFRRDVSRAAENRTQARTAQAFGG